ncbi:MAG: biotin--[acetyl-CoA-carboxylase] ligase [Fusobacteriaceae bacterium]
MKEKITLKNKVLKLLEEHKGKNISGEEIAGIFDVSRTSVWKVIKNLKEQGYKITSVTNKGYVLSEENDFFSQEKIVNSLKECNEFSEVQIFKTLDSTNNQAKKMAIEGASSGTLILAEEQTNGRGRRGREFYSPANSGIYMSLILKPNFSMEEIPLITTGACVAVCRAIEKLFQVSPKIKWINDIYLDDKKVCGILTEGVTNFESGSIESVILGIGINFNTMDFPGELKKKAGSILNEKTQRVSRNDLVSEIVLEIFKVLEEIPERKYLAEYKERSWVLGSYVEVLSSNRNYTAKALDISEDGALIVIDEFGKLEYLNSGEISILKKSKI